MCIIMHGAVKILGALIVKILEKVDNVKLFLLRILMNQTEFYDENRGVDNLVTL